MNLLSWAKKEVNKVGHAINQDVVQPVAHVAGDVTQAAQQAPQQIEQAVSQVPRIAQIQLPKVAAQVNPLDNNRTFRNPQGNGGATPPSAFQQLAHSGASNFVGDNVVKPLAQFPIDASSQIYNRVVAPAIGAPKLTPTQVTPIQGLSKGVGATGSLHQTVGSGIQTALTIGSGGLAKGIEAGVSKVIPATVPKVVASLAPKLASNAAIGAGFNASATAGQGGTAKQIAESAATGAALGAAIPVAGAGAKVVGKVGAKVIQSGVDNRVPFNAVGAVGKDVNKPLPALPDKSPAISSQPVKLQNTENITGQGSVQNTNAAIPPPVGYLRQQIKAQEIARRAGSPGGFGKLGAAKSEAKQKLLDSFAPIEDTLNKSIKGGVKVAPEQNIKYQIDRAIRGDTIGAQYIKDNGLAKVIQNVPNTKEFDQYLIAKHAADLEKNGIQTDRNLTADKQLVQNLAPKYEPHAQALKQYSQGLLDTATNYGLINKDLVTHLKEKYPNYVPVNRIFGEGELPTPPKGISGGKASIGSQSVVQKIKGSTRQIESPLSSLIYKSVTVAKEGERNKAAQILANYKDLPGNPFQLRELSKDEIVGIKPIISYLDQGKVRRFETTPEIASAAKALNKEQLGLVGRILAAPTRLLRLGATGLNPAFALANVTKDSVSAFINSSHPLRSSVANPKVFVEALKAAVNHDSPQYGELVRQAAGGTSFDIARNAPVQNVRSIRAGKNAATKALYTVTTPSQLFRAAENAIGRSEEFNRAMQYFGNKEAALKSGNSVERAQILGAHAARSNTVNFARAGDFGRVANSVLPYLNAGIQGSRTLLRNLKDRPLQTGTKLAVSTFFPVAVITAWNTSDPQRKAAYDDIKDYEKQGSFIIVPPHPVKDKNGKWNVIKIPMSQEIANLANIVRNGVEAATKDGSLNVAQMLGNAVGTVTSLNTQSGRQVVGQLTPQALKPGLETLQNKNIYTGNPIVPDSQKNLSPKDQIGQGTSGTATELGKLSGLSPRQIDNAIRTATGGLGQNVIHYSDSALAKAGAINPNQVQGKSVPEAVSGRFSGAQGKTGYDVADAKFTSFKKQLENTSEFKNLSPQDKAKALNRLQSSVTAAYVPPKDKNGNQKPLGVRQQDILSGTPDLKSYLTTQTGGSASSKTAYKSPDAEYKTLQKKFNDNVKNNSFGSDAEKIKAQKTLNKAKVGSTYDKSVRDLYGLSKADIYQYVTTNQNGKAIADKLIAYDQALKNSGVTSALKFKTGLAPSVTKGGSRGGRKSTGKASLTKTLSTLKSINAAVKPPKAPKAPKFAIKSAKPKKTSLKKYAIKRPTQSKVKVA